MLAKLPAQTYQSVVLETQDPIPVPVTFSFEWHEAASVIGGD
jgi:hypothetical protein